MEKTTIKFTVIGNQENPNGNPLGYVRTLNHSWTDSATKYFAWKEYVKKAYRHAGYKYEDPLQNEPLTTSKEKRVRMDINIFFANDQRSDADNVYKGVGDSLFKNDKYIMEGSFECHYAEDKKGRLEIEITYI